MGRRLHPVSSLSDLVPGRDVVVRTKSGHCYVKDTWGSYAPRQVESDVLTPEAAERFRRMTREQQETMALCWLATPWLSPEGRRERIWLGVECGVITLRLEVNGGPLAAPDKLQAVSPIPPSEEPIMPPTTEKKPRTNKTQTDIARLEKKLAKQVAELAATHQELEKARALLAEESKARPDDGKDEQE